jgi:hypothetical protein
LTILNWNLYRNLNNLVCLWFLGLDVIRYWRVLDSGSFLIEWVGTLHFAFNCSKRLNIWHDSGSYIF